MRQFLVILRGAPASGKTTIAKKLRNLDQKIAWLKVDNFKEFFADDSSQALEYVHSSAVATLEYLIDKNFSVVMDGVFQDTKAIDLALDLADKKNLKAVVYQLHCSLTVLQERDKTRPGVKEGCRQLLGDDTIAVIYQRLENNFYQQARTLDTENLTLDQCINRILMDIGEPGDSRS